MLRVLVVMAPAHLTLASLMVLTGLFVGMSSPARGQTPPASPPLGPITHPFERRLPLRTTFCFRTSSMEPAARDLTTLSCDRGPGGGVVCELTRTRKTASGTHAPTRQVFKDHAACEAGLMECKNEFGRAWMTVAATGSSLRLSQCAGSAVDACVTYRIDLGRGNRVTRVSRPDDRETRARLVGCRVPARTRR